MKNVLIVVVTLVIVVIGLGIYGAYKHRQDTDNLLGRIHTEQDRLARSSASYQTPDTQSRSALATVTVSACDKADRMERVRHLVEADGSFSAAKMALRKELSASKEKYPEVPDAVWTLVLSDEYMLSLRDKLCDVYVKYYTAEDVECAIKFYDSPTGRKMLDAQPAMLEDAEKAGEQWGVESAMKAMKKLHLDKTAAPM